MPPLWSSPTPRAASPRNRVRTPFPRLTVCCTCGRSLGWEINKISQEPCTSICEREAEAKWEWSTTGAMPTGSIRGCFACPTRGQHEVAGVGVEYTVRGLIVWGQLNVRWVGTDDLGLFVRKDRKKKKKRSETRITASYASKFEKKKPHMHHTEWDSIRITPDVLVGRVRPSPTTQSWSHGPLVPPQLCLCVIQLHCEATPLVHVTVVHFWKVRLGRMEIQILMSGRSIEQNFVFSDISPHALSLSPPSDAKASACAQVLQSNPDSLCTYRPLGANQISACFGLALWCVCNTARSPWEHAHTNMSLIHCTPIRRLCKRSRCTVPFLVHVLYARRAQLLAAAARQPLQIRT